VFGHETEEDTENATTIYPKELSTLHIDIIMVSRSWYGFGAGQSSLMKSQYLSDCSCP
jgi:hypothetical protein